MSGYGTVLSALTTSLAVPAADATANVDIADVIGNKADAAVQAVAATKSEIAYVKGILDALMGTAGAVTWPASAAPANGVSLLEAIRWMHDTIEGATGVAGGTWPAALAPANGVSLVEAIREMYDLMEKPAVKAAAAITNGQTLFTIAGGSIEILQLGSYCETANDGTASTLQYSSTPTLGSAKTISGASASLASAAAGAFVVLNPTSLATAPDLITAANGGVAIGANVGNRIIVHPGIITAVVGVGSTTGTWSHMLRYRPMKRGVTVT